MVECKTVEDFVNFILEGKTSFNNLTIDEEFGFNELYKYANDNKDKDPAHQYIYGLCSYEGYGCGKDYLRANEYITKAADAGFSRAQVTLGQMYENGDVVEQNYNTALELYAKAAEQGNIDAMCNSGYIYNAGLVLVEYDVDMGKAFEWYMKAAEAGDMYAQCNIGTFYYTGAGVDFSLEKAAEWYEKSAAQGYDEAQYNLGNCYFMGEGVAQDYAKALDLYTKAGEQGNGGGFNNAGVCYEFGLGTDVDLEKAISYFNAAIDLGWEEDARVHLAEIYQAWGVCSHCGGEFIKTDAIECAICGKVKDY